MCHTSSGATLAGFGENNGVVYAKCHKSIICIIVQYELIKGITVLYGSYISYAVDNYFMNYTAHLGSLGGMNPEALFACHASQSMHK